MPWFQEGEILEIRIRDVQALDELPAMIDINGTTINAFRIWVRRGAIAVRFEPFEVTDEKYRPFDTRSISRILSKRES